ncbi:hypothetical protein [Ralstonia flatus]|uniref:hypothetical protein n=1 Tax=Ralstonia flatus TaxID=3058601 RepID=UPI00292FF41A|nr:hypothetical protein [Ralstonia sp. LMG 32965]
MLPNLDRIGQLAEQRKRHGDTVQRTATVPIALSAEEWVAGIRHRQPLPGTQGRVQFLDQGLHQ